MRTRVKSIAVVSLLILLAGGYVPAVAEAPTNAGLEEITVTARKREESVMRTPVVMQVISAQQIKDQKIYSMVDFLAAAPGLQANPGYGAVGVVLFMRGIGSGNGGEYIDQSVGLNIDGVGFTQGSWYRAASFDLAQMELLKGPQNLFFGKSTTAGIVAFHTADPTPTWETEATAGYEFNAEEWRLDGHVSGPITDKLGIRVAGYYDSMAGYMFNLNPAAAEHRAPDSEDYGGRLTLKWDDPDTGFRAKLKVSATHYYSFGSPSNQTNSYFGCPTGVPQTIHPYAVCQAGDHNLGQGTGSSYNPNVNWYAPASGALLGTFSPNPYQRDGNSYMLNKTLNVMLQLDYDIMQGLTLTSVTGASSLDDIDSVGVFYFGLNTAGHLATRWRDREYSEELRLTSDWKDSWINFTAGGLIAPGVTNEIYPGDIPSFFIWNDSRVGQDIRDESAFGQVLLTPISKWELAAGLRYTRVHKFFNLLSVYNNFIDIPGNIGVNQVPLIPQNQRDITEDNTSPEVTLTYRPTEDWTIFASYKEGFKGPGFNNNEFLTGSYNPAIIPNQVSTFGGEHTKGFEGGLKAAVLDHHMNLTLSLYDYKYEGLQVSNYDFLTRVFSTTNGANAITKGIEVGMQYQPEMVEGLQIDFNGAYNDGHFTSFPYSPCWGGQTAAEGCITDPVTGAQTQNLAGHRLFQAPRFVGDFGGTYQTSVTGNYTLSFHADVDFSSGYFTVADLLPDSYQKGYAVLNAAIHFSRQDGLWDVALIGRNLTQNYYILSAQDGGTVTPGVMADAYGFPARGRQIMLQITVKPHLF